MLILIEKHKESLCEALMFEFDRIERHERKIGIYNTLRDLGFKEEAAETHRELVIEGIVEPYTF